MKEIWLEIQRYWRCGRTHCKYVSSSLLLCLFLTICRRIEKKMQTLHNILVWPWHFLPKHVTGPVEHKIFTASHYSFLESTLLEAMLQQMFPLENKRQQHSFHLCAPCLWNNLPPCFPCTPTHSFMPSLGLIMLCPAFLRLSARRMEEKLWPQEEVQSCSMWSLVKARRK